MNLENVKMLELAAEHLDSLFGEVVFVGGATVELWITDEAAPEFRPTDDIDVIAEITTTRDFHRFEKRVRELGLENDQQSGVICRFRHPGSGLLLDVMPTEASILGFENRWQGEAFPHAVEVALPSGRSIRAIPPPFLLATKLEAFKTRGKGDLYGSRDFGDVVALIDGRGVDCGSGGRPRGAARVRCRSVQRAVPTPGLRQRVRGSPPVQPRDARACGEGHNAQDRGDRRRGKSVVIGGDSPRFAIGRRPRISSPKATQNPWNPTATVPTRLLRQALQPGQIILIARRL